MRKYRWVAISILGVIGMVVVLDCYVFGYFSLNKTDIAARQCQQLSKYCEIYQLKPQSKNQWPERLEDLVLDKPGVTPILDGGIDAIRDPWGKPYRYARFDSPEGTSIYIWTEYEKDKVLHFIGVRRNPDGHLMRFARVED